MTNILPSRVAHYTYKLITYEGIRNRRKGSKTQIKGTTHQDSCGYIGKASPKGVDMLVSDCPGSGGTGQLCVTEERQQLFKDMKG